MNLTTELSADSNISLSISNKTESISTGLQSDPKIQQIPPHPDNILFLFAPIVVLFSIFCLTCLVGLE